VKTFPSANREIPMADPTPTINRTWGSLVVLSSRRRPVCHVSCGKLKQPMYWGSSRSDLGGGSRKEREKSLREREREREGGREIRRRVTIPEILSIESSYRPSCVTTVLSTACIHWAAVGWAANPEMHVTQPWGCVHHSLAFNDLIQKCQLRIEMVDSA